jgi:hypothetical protein
MSESFAENIKDMQLQAVKLSNGHEIVVPLNDTEMLKTIIKHDEHMLMRETMAMKYDQEEKIPPARTWAYVIFCGEVLAFVAFLLWLAFG